MKRIIIFFLVSLVVFLTSCLQDKNRVKIKIDSLETLAENFLNEENYNEAIRVATKAKKSAEKVFGKEDSIYATALSCLADCNFQSGIYDEALRLGIEAMNIFETIDKEDLGYASSLNNLATYNAYLGKYTEAFQYGTKALEITGKVVGKEDSIYATALSNLAGYICELGNYPESIRLETEALGIKERVLGNEHPNYAMSLRNLACYNIYLGNYNEAIRLNTEALEIIGKKKGKESRDYAKALGNLANDYLWLGKYTEASNLCMEAQEIWEKLLSKGDPDYDTIHSSIENGNFNLDKKGEYGQLETKAMEIREKVLGKDYINYGGLLDNLAIINDHLGESLEAMSLCIKAMYIYHIKLGIDHPYYAHTCSILAYTCSNLAHTYSNLAHAYSNPAHTYGNPEYTWSNPEYALSYYSIESYKDAIGFETTAMEILEKVLGKDHPNYAQSLINLADYYFGSGDFKEASQYAVDATHHISQIVWNTFRDLTARERSSFWDKYKYWFEGTLPRFAFYIREDSLTATTYNGALMDKGLLLNSEIAMYDLLLESGDTVAVEKYQVLRNNRAILNRLYETPVDERKMNTDSLEQIVQEQDRELTQLSKTYGDYTKNLSINWQQVQEKLGNDDVAIEFINFATTNDSVMYAALILTKTDSVPHMIPLFEKSELDSIKEKSFYVTQELSRLIWKPLSGELEGKKNIYFSPTGELHCIAIESLPSFKGEGYMFDHWNLYRLSSTRELVKTKEKYETKDAYLYGGLKYDMDVDLLIADSKKYHNTQRSIDWTVSHIADTLSARGKIPQNPKYLNGTKEEVEAIAKSLRARNVNATVLTDTIGTEASFKALNGTKPNILHIATHGFFLTESEAKEQKAQLFQPSMDNNAGPKDVEDKALTRSGLLFAGVKNAQNGTLPENVDNGILTAKEISDLDLRGLDLVVLSACETGLGEITGDGVFGLQRGFFKAGANTLIMSLWEVDDTATKMLMMEFYANLAKGKTKYEAFREAQQYVKSRPGYEEPDDWAGFILLNAID